MHKKILLLFCLLPGPFCFGQINLTPYSRFGLGEIFSVNANRNFAMGGAGIGMTDATSLNTSNPASWASIRLTTLEFSGIIGYKQQATPSVSNRFLTGSFYQAGFAFRTNRKLTFAIGLNPWSGTNYRITLHDTLTADTSKIPFTHSYTAKGGINELYVGAGATFFKKINAGISFPYLFGASRFNTLTFADGGGTSVVPGFVSKRVNLYGFVPRAGVQYEDTLRFTRKVDLLKETRQHQKDLGHDMRKTEAELEKVANAKAKNEALDKAADPERQRLDAEKKALKDSENAARESGAISEREIEKIEGRYRKINNQRKRIDQKIQKERKKIQDKERTLGRKKDKIQNQQNMLSEKEKKILSDSALRYEKRRDSLVLGLGGVADLPSKLKGEKITEYTNSQVSDTLVSLTGSTTIPLRIGGGISLSRPGKWQIGADFNWQQWGNFTYFDESYTFRPSWSIHAGGEYTRDPFSNRIARKLTWRGGLFYENSGLVVNGNEIRRMGVTFGVGIPLARVVRDAKEKPWFSKINLGVSAGTQGTIDSGLLRESFITLRIGVNLNDRWFRKRSLE